MELQRITLLLALGGTLLAGEPDPADKPKPKAEAGATVTVTAEAAPVERTKTPCPVIVLDAERIHESSARTAAEALANILPGQITSYGGVGSGNTLFLNGARGNDAVVVQDGIRITEVNALGVDLSFFPLIGVDRAEILSGAASSLFGGDAHGGVVSFHSSGPAKSGFSGRLNHESGTQGRQRTVLAPAYGWNGGWVRAEGTAAQENQPTETDNPFRQAAGYLGLGQALGERHLLTVNYRQQYQATPIPWNWPFRPDYLSLRSYDPTRESEQRFQALTGSWRAAWTDSLASELNVGQVGMHRFYTDTQSAFNSRRNQVNGNVSWDKDSFGLSAMADTFEDLAWNADPANKSFGRHAAVAMEARYELFQVLRIVASGRQQWDHLGQEGLSATAFPDGHFAKFTYRVGANLLLKSGFRAFINRGTAFNTPSLFQINTNTLLNRPVPGNEDSATTQAGVGLERGPWHTRLEANRTCYGNLVNYVGYYPNGYYVNEGGYRVQGMELAGGYRADKWAVEGFLRSQEGRDGKLPEEKQRSTFSGRPFFMAGARGNWAFGDFRFDGQVSYQGHRYAYDSDFGLYGGSTAIRTHFVDLNLSSTYRASRDMDFVLRGEHLLQNPMTRGAWERKEDVGQNNRSLLPGFPAQTRLVSLEARYRF